ncbi:5'-nucleotidase C-terminal domain-containing protein [Halomonas sabkhae]|uniref:DUF4214 domain-containing protein n=1 Tax=Halomonas sabkhae TaxID=626223 RepID=UPI0025B37F8E|nr:DUF4214 domain-containing protein [Halomonas sabkhae]MDN3524154.1 5'-nucleotidase C-terminal domain-containing protein [Halomonas sabkhae]
MSYRLQLLHAADMEGGGGDLLNAPNFVSIVDYLEDLESNSLFVSSGDLVLPGPYLEAASDDSLQPALQAAAETIYDQPEGSLEGITAASGRVETLLADLMDTEAVTLGNHEFDQGTGLIADMVAARAGESGELADIEWPGSGFPYLSANLDFSADEALAGLASGEPLEDAAFRASPEAVAGGATPPKLAPAMVTERGGEQIGVIGLTTQILESVSSPGGTEVLGGDENDMPALAEIVQPVVDQLESQGVNKIILASHLQQIQLEEELATLLDGVDIVMAGGSNTLLADQEDSERGLFPGAGEPYKQYPIMTQDAAGDDVAVINTDGGWRYVGRLVAEFDDQGRLIKESIEPQDSGVYASTDEQVADLWGSREAAFAEGTKGAVAEDLVGSVQDFVAEQDGNVQGLSDVYLEGRREAVRTEETNLGNLTADANRWYARQVDDSVQVSIKNGGGIREPIGTSVVEGADGRVETLPPQANEEIGKPAGGVSQLDIGASLRFNNDLAIVSLSREELVGALEHAVAASAPDVTAGQFAQVSGIRYSFDWSQPAGERLQSAAIVDDNGDMADVLVANGQLIGNADSEVRVVTLGFLADGGDGYPLGEGVNDERVDLVESDIAAGESTFAKTGTEQDAFAEYLQAMYSETPFAQEETPASEDKRIQNLNERGDSVLVGNVDGVARLYDAAFDRAADGSGLGYWLGHSEQLNLDDIADYFVSSQEYAALHGNLDDDAYVDMLYANVLEREADADGRDYWMQQLQSGDSRGDVMVGFTESEESLMLAG